ncbi:RICIN domain-containing protein [Calothrix sp. PCC 7507]|uniref:RICIN domain-containing protein n=1 Tax=Calothrix sp. PCC 7507 TaxID=99598 RepID=UPI00029F4D15|nr:RICIN domain-containing protein [Calothrix sp. PCC 7507]AFY31832.1 Ricin B lectin [Calothrix sp. PCC 7507]
MSNNICKSVALAIGSLSLALFVGSASAHAETFSVQGGMALNTNNNFSRIDGNPRMSIYRLNNNDNDQQFDRLSGNRGGILLKHRSTGKCLNAHYLSQGSQINVWPCDANDPDQNWNLVNVGSGYNLIKRTGTNLCVDSPTRDNQGKVHLINCDANNGNQRWNSSSSPPPIVSNGQINLPFSSGQTWYVCQGYRGGVTHNYENANSYHNIYSLDITVENNSWGLKGCSSPNDVNKSAGNKILAPVSGNVEKVSWADDLVCLTNDSRTKSFLIGHMVPSTKFIGRVNQDAVIGTVKRYTSSNGYAHIHITAYNQVGCKGASIPFTDAYGVQFNGTSNLPSLDTPKSKPMNQHRGTALRR